MAEAETIEIDAGIDLAQIEQALENGREEIERNARGLARLSWPRVREGVAVAIRDELGKDMLPWLAGAWTTARELHRFKDANVYPPGADSYYEMIPQSVEGTLHPTISVRCAGAEVASLTFDVTVTADFHCLALVIRDARITGISGGDYEINLKIGLNGYDLSGPIELDKSRLPGRVPFARSLPIP